jgi:hypothetical protein
VASVARRATAVTFVVMVDQSNVEIVRATGIKRRNAGTRVIRTLAMT